MNTNIFTKCLQVKEVNTGEFIGVYSLTSGTTGVAFNLLKPTGEAYVNGFINSVSNPLISLSNDSIFGGRFSGEHVGRYGYEHSPEDWQHIVDFEFDRCAYTGQTGHSRILLSSKDYPSQSSGFLVGINSANRLYFSCGESSIYTLNSELSPKSIISVSLADEQYLSLGAYDFGADSFYQEKFDIGNTYTPSNKWYLGNVLSGQNGFSGFSGTIYRSAFLSGNLDERQSAECVECWFSTGITSGWTTGETITETITGFELLRSSGQEITGYAYVSGYVTRPDGSVRTVLIYSGSYGSVFQEEQLRPLTGSYTGILTGEPFYGVQYDLASKMAYTAYSVLFDIPLTSGDLVSIYNYNEVNTNVNIPMEGFELSLEDGYKNVVGNGLLETLNVDYTLDGNIVVGFDESDILIQDITNGNSIITPWSGLWSRSKILTGQSPDRYFPSGSQYTEGANGLIHTTGISGICYDNEYYPNFGYDLYMNGQKLVTGIHYNYVLSGQQFGLRFSGSGLPDFNAEVTYSGSVATSIEDIQASELTFLPKENSPIETLLEITGETTTIMGLSGVSEQIWVNGVRQKEGIDYIRDEACSVSSGTEGQYDSYSKLIFDNDVNRVNVEDENSYFILYENGQIKAEKAAVIAERSSTNTWPAGTQVYIPEGFYYNPFTQSDSTTPINSNIVGYIKMKFGDYHYYRSSLNYFRYQASPIIII